MPLVKFDMHCHAKEGSVDAKLSIFDYAGVLKQKGYQGMLITDHDSYRSWKAWETEKKEQNKMEAEDFYIIKGIEYDTIDAGHFIVIMPDGVNLPILEMRGLPLLLLIALVHRYGGILGPAHPYGASFTSANRAERLPGYRYAMSQVDFIETFNAAESYGSNSLAKKLAESYGKPETGGSDSHRLSGAATGYTLIDCDSITCANGNQGTQNLRDRRSQPLGKRRKEYAGYIKAGWSCVPVLQPWTGTCASAQPQTRVEACDGLKRGKRKERSACSRCSAWMRQTFFI